MWLEHMLYRYRLFLAHKNQATREVVEALHIVRRDKICISSSLCKPLPTDVPALSRVLCSHKFVAKFSGGAFLAAYKTTDIWLHFCHQVHPLFQDHMHTVAV